MVKQVLIVFLIHFFTFSSTSYSQSNPPVQHICGSGCSHQNASALGANPSLQSNQTERCATDQLHFDKMQNDKGYPARVQDIEDFTNSFVQQHMADTNGTTRTIYTIPVVVHVVYNTPAQNISDAQIHSQIDVLNEDFRRLNADTVNTPSAFLGIAADTEIEFCLAVRDPNGQPTTGITRTQTSVSAFTSNSAVKFNSQGGKDAWPRDSYMNFWICNLTGGLLGYAQYPGGNALTDGVVVNYTNVGRPPHNPFINTYNRGRTGTHEVGHWLNLRHIWGDSYCGNDLVNDTPTQQGANYGCPSFPRRPNSCGQSNPNGDMYVNYMDYTTDACMNSFSHGQKLRMLAVLNGPRSSLLNSIACIPVTSQPYSDFNLTLTNICPGDQIQFSDNSQNGPTSWSWSFPGGIPATSNSQNPTVTYPNAGDFDVILTTSNANGSHTVTMNNLINVDYYGESILFLEDFESNSFNTNGWTIENPDNHIGWEIVSVGGSQSGNRAARVNHYSYSAIGERDAMITPPLDFTNYDSLKLSFQHAYRRFNNLTSDTLRIYASTDNGQSWPHLIFEEAEDGSYNFATAVNTTANFVPTTLHNWCFSGSVGASCFELDLSDFEGYTNVRVKFETANSYGNNLYIDNVMVKGRCLSSGPPISNLQADFESNEQEVCSGDDVVFNDLSGSSVSWRQWEFLGANPPTSNAANPTVNYTTAGSFDVILTVANGSDTSTLLLEDYITVNSIPNVTSTQSNVSCSGVPTGEISLTASNGNAPYVFTWQHGATGSQIQNLTPGSYSVTVTDNNGCSTQENYSITQPQAIQVQSNIVHPDCGLTNGGITLNVSGGSAPYQYNWSNGQQTSQINSLSGGSYSVTITDDNLCSTSEAFVVNQNSGLQLTYQKTNLSCNNSNDGSVTVTATGGNAPYAFTWQHGVTGSSLQNLNAGTYTVTVTDDNGCSALETIEVTEPAPTNLNANVTHTSCGFSNGSISLQPSVQNGPYSYNWSNGSQQAQITGIASGNYSVTVSDANGCEISENYTVIGSGNIQLTHQKTDLTCNNSSDGSITVSATGGNAPYVFTWQHGATGSQLQNLTPGSYSVTVTDNNGCSTQENYSITEPQAIQVQSNINHPDCGLTNGGITLNVSGGSAPYQYDWSNGQQTSQINSLSAGSYSVTITDDNLCSISETFVVNHNSGMQLTYQKTNLSCNNSNDGSITVSATGGNAPYAFTWQHGVTGSSLQNLNAGTYTVTVTDDNGCSALETIEVTEPALTNLNADITHTSCGISNGSISLQLSAPNAPYSYNWSNGSQQAQITGIASGNYSVTVSDANGCEISDNYTVNASGNIQLTHQKTDLTCNNSSDGSITVSATGGNAPYVFTWQHGVTGNNLQNLDAGIYTVTVTDNNGCSTQETIELTEPSPTNLSANVSHVTCGSSNGSISLQLSGQNAPYSYNWSNGSQQAQITGLSSGNYSVTVSDANGCEITENYNISGGGNIQLTYQKTDLTCNNSNDGSITVSASGANSPYQFNWQHGASGASLQNLSAGSYTVVVVDSDGCSTQEVIVISEPAPITAQATKVDATCGSVNGSISLAVSGGNGPYQYNWSNGAQTPQINSLAYGVYDVTITDANQCSIVESYSISGSSILHLTYQATDVSCAGGSDGSITVLASGGTAPYQYSWLHGFNGNNPQNLAAGFYTVMITDSMGCTEQRTIEIYEPLSLSLHETITDVTCAGEDGSINIAVSGGTGAYQYNWSNGLTTNQISNLSEGTYSLTVTDSNGCNTSASYQVDSTGTPEIQYVKSNVSCATFEDGSINVSVSGGVGPYSYSWSNGETTNTQANLLAGLYTVTVTDNIQCTAVKNIQITEPLPINVSGQVSSTSCVGNDGSINQAVFGGTSPYTFNWNNGSNSQNANSLSTGVHNVIITDNNGCIYEKSYFVPVSNSLNVNYIVENETCEAAGDGSIELSIQNGTAPFTYQWNTGNTGAKIENLSSGNYHVVITDANSCSKTLQISVEEDSIPTPVLLIENDVCGLIQGTAEVLFKEGLNPDVLWSTGQTMNAINGLSAGSYTLTVDYNPNCQTTIDFDITAGLVVDMQVETSADDGSSNGSIKVKPINAVTPVTYSWENIPGNNQSYIHGLSHGSYVVDVIDARGCVASKQANVALELISSNQEQLIESEVSLSIYPNPNSGQFNIEWSNTVSEDTKLFLYDLKGRTVIEIEFGMIKTLSKNLNLESLAKGAYILSIVSDNKHHNQKVILK